MTRLRAQSHWDITPQQREGKSSDTYKSPVTLIGLTPLEILEWWVRYKVDRNTGIVDIELYDGGTSVLLNIKDGYDRIRPAEVDARALVRNFKRFIENGGRQDP